MLNKLLVLTCLLGFGVGVMGVGSGCIVEHDPHHWYHDDHGWHRYDNDHPYHDDYDHHY